MMGGDSQSIWMGSEFKHMKITIVLFLLSDEIFFYLLGYINP